MTPGIDPIPGVIIVGDRGIRTASFCAPAKFVVLGLVTTK
jgi:hypothetical protein